MNWFPLHNHSHFSLLDGLSQPSQIAERVVECGFAGCALTDHGNVCGCPPFLKALQNVCQCGHQKSLHPSGECSKRCGCKKFEKAGLKPVLGCEFYLCQQDATVKDKSNGSLSHLCVLAPRRLGWKNLMRACSASYSPEFFYRKPRLDLGRLASFSQGEFVAFSGHMGSDLANVIFEDAKLAYSARNADDAKSMTRKDWPKHTIELARKYESLFGTGNFWIEIQLLDYRYLPASLVVAEGLRWVAKKTGIPCVATADSHYCRQEDAPDQRDLLCMSMDTTRAEVARKLANNEDVGLGAFFRSSNYHIPSLAEMADIHTPEEMRNATKIGELAEDYSISGKPLLPTFGLPGESPDGHLKALCRSEWKQKISQADQARPSYRERIKKEIEVVCSAGLASYFLIVRDYVDYAKGRGWLVGKGRGSAAGCLVSYLLGITGVDPVKADLLFERFYNAGRNTPDRVALPDIDCDFPVAHRDELIGYVRDKYGKANVAQMATFSRMQGKGALKDVLRVNDACSFEEMNRITEHVPDEAEISDQLQGMLEDTGEASIIRWSLEHHGEQLKEWCYLNEKGEPDGPMAQYFAEAIRLEGTKRNIGRHASGLIISSVPLGEMVPMVWDRSSEQYIVGVDMRDAEEMGLVKFDILGTAVLDKIAAAESIVRTGK